MIRTTNKKHTKKPAPTVPWVDSSTLQIQLNQDCKVVSQNIATNNKMFPMIEVKAELMGQGAKRRFKGVDKVGVFKNPTKA